MSTTTSRLALTQPVGSDPPSALRTSIGGNATILDNAAVFLSGALVSRPAASIAGRYYLATDVHDGGPQGTLYQDNGSTWVYPNQVAYAQGTAASRPSAGTTGRVWQSTDTNQVSLDNGTVWIDVGLTSTVTALPGSPYDGQEIRFLADSANGVVWHLRYRAASASTYKWEFMGGAPLHSEVTTQEGLTSAGPANLATVGPSITLPTLPNGGDFDVTTSGNISAVAGSVQGIMSYAIGAATASVNDGVVAAWSSTAGIQVNQDRTQRKTGLASATILTAKYWAVSGQVFFSGRRLAVVPVRVG